MPEVDLLQTADRRILRAFLAGLVRRHQGALTVVLLVHGCAATAGLVAPRLVGTLVQRVTHGAGLSTVNSMLLIIAAVMVLQAGLIMVAVVLSTGLAERILAELREYFLSRVLGLPLPVIERAGVGYLSTRITRDIDALYRSARFAVPEVTIAVLTCSLSAAAILFVNPWLILPVLIVVPPAWFFTRWYAQRAPAGYLREETEYGEILGTLNEIVDGSRTLEALGADRHQRRRLEDAISRAYGAQRYTLWLRTIWAPNLDLDYFIPMISTLLFGGWMYSRGTVTLGELTAVVLYLNMLVGPLNQILIWVYELQLGRIALSRLLALPEVANRDRPAGLRTAEPVNDLVIRDLSYAYEPGREVLRRLDLEVPAGETLVIVGPSGAGKSTLARLMAGVYAPKSGTVSIADVEVSCMPLDDLRRRVVLVTQEHHVFSGSLRDNVAMVKPEITDAAVLEALRTVGALDWVERLPEGLQCVVGERGVRLTEAQAQQLALARLLVVDPQILILDEATSLLDTRAARRLERSLFSVLRGRGVVMIAHRLQAAVDADRVAVLEDGRLTQLGSHDELLRQDGTYSSLWRAWDIQYR